MQKACIVFAALLVACGTTNNNGTPDAGPVIKKKVLLDITGKVMYHPAELEWREKHCGGGSSGGADAGTDVDGGTTGPTENCSKTPPPIEGAGVAVEDALKALSELEPLTGKDRTPLPANGEFSFKQVDVTNSTIAIVASVKDKNDPNPSGIFFSAYGLGRPPFKQEEYNKTKPVYIVSDFFVDKLIAAISTKYQTVTKAKVNKDGFVFGGATERIPNPSLTPPVAYKIVEGSYLAKTFAGSTETTLIKNGELTSPDDANSAKVEIYYLNDDLTGVVEPGADGKTRTTKSGLFVRLNAGSAQTYKMLNDDTAKVSVEKLSGSRAKTALVVFWELFED